MTREIRTYTSGFNQISQDITLRRWPIFSLGPHNMYTHSRGRGESSRVHGAYLNSPWDMVEGSGQQCSTTAVVRSCRKLPNPYRSFKGRASDRVASKVATATGSVRCSRLINQKRSTHTPVRARERNEIFVHVRVTRRKTETKTVMCCIYILCWRRGRG